MPSIVELAAAITDNTNKVNDYMIQNNLPSPSLDDIDSPISWNISPEAKDILIARKAAIEATSELKAKLLGPREHLVDMLRVWDLVPIQAVVEFKLAEALPITEEVSVPELAQQTGVIGEHNLERLLRHAINLKVFEYSKPGHIRHSVLSRMIAENIDVRDYVGCALGDMWQSAGQTVNALAKFPQSQEPKESGFNLSHDTELTLYQYFEKHPARAKRFGNAMACIATRNPAFAINHVFNGYAWGNLDNGLVVDIGGSNGFVAIALAEAFPHLRCIVQDLPAVVKDLEVPSSLNGRVTFAAHDFFEVQPVKNADVYFFRWVIHGWPDKYAIQILQNLIPAMKAGAKVVVCDEILPVYGTVPNEVEFNLSTLDMIMMGLQNARLRSAADWRTLFEQADSRFVLKSIKTPPGSRLGFIEAEWNGTAMY